MSIESLRDIDRLRLLSTVGQIGWWEADFSNREFLCSGYLQRLFGFKTDRPSFDDFIACIREDYRVRLACGFHSLEDIEVYEQFFPTVTPEGEVWMHSRLGKKWRDEEGNFRAFGTLQRMEAPSEKRADEYLQKVSNLQLRQYSMAHSLRNFLQKKSMKEVIESVLGDILSLFRGGRAYIFEYDDKGQTQSCTYEVVSAGVSPQKEMLRDLSQDIMPWWTSQIREDKPILLNSLSDLPPEATVEYDLLSCQAIKSLMAVPLRNADRVWGFIGIDLVDRHYSWSNTDYQWFSSLASIINICISLRLARDEADRERAFLVDLYRHMPMGYVRLTIICDEQGVPTDYRITDANRLSSELCGQPLEVYKGRLASEVYSPDVLRKKLDFLLEIRTTGTFREMDEFFKATRRTCHCIIYSPQPGELVCLYLDVTEMRRTYRALDKSEKLLRSIFSNIPVGIEIYDSDGRLIDINSKDMEIFGIRRKEDALGINFFENPNVSPEMCERLRREDELDLSKEYDFDNLGGYYPSRHSGSINLYTKVNKTYSSLGEYTGFLVINIDNTERISSLNRIRDFENFFLLISDYAKVGYAKLNLLNREGYAIKQWFKNMGEGENTPLSEVVGVYRHMHPSDRVRVLQFFNRAHRGEARNFHGEMRIRRPGTQDEWNWVRMSIVVNRYEPEHGLLELIGVNYDITELKETEQMLIRAKEKAEGADRLKMAFLANMSHEIRTPLNAIVGFSSLLVEPGEVEERQEYLRIVEENNELLLQLISDILDLSKIESGTFDIDLQPVDVNVLCADIARAMRLRVKPGVELLYEPDEEECIVTSDPHRLHQVVSNFVNNAIKFTTRGYIRIGYGRPVPGQLRVFVEDTGVGIAPDKCEAVFERFVKLNAFVQGTGLGLPISRCIIERLGGRIGVDSELGRGSTFWFTLPV